VTPFPLAVALGHSHLEGVTVEGNDLVLSVRPLVWQGGRGRYGDAMRVRFRGVTRPGHVIATLTTAPVEFGELGGLFYGPQHCSTATDLRLLLVAERYDRSVGIRCQRVTLDTGS
jgi:hypothetical protein